MLQHNRAPQIWPEDGSLPEHVQRFVEWLVMPKWERPADEQSQAAWARKNGVARETVTTWKRDPRVKKAIEARCDELNVSVDRIQAVVNTLFQNAENGDVKAAQLYLQYVDRLTPKRVIIEDRRISDMSDDELAKELRAAGVQL